MFINICNTNSESADIRGETCPWAGNSKPWSSSIVKITYLIICPGTKHSTSHGVSMSLEYRNRVVIGLSEIPESEGRIFGGCHNQSGRGMSGRMGQLLVVARQLMQHLSSLSVPQDSHSVPTGSHSLKQFNFPSSFILLVHSL